MKLLVLSCNTGEGHNSAAKAISETLLSKGHECDICDALAFASPRISRAIAHIHTFTYCKMPHVFGAGYSVEEKFPELMRAAMSGIISRGAARLNGCVSDYDAVICTHIFGAMMVSKLKKRYGRRIPAFFVATDYCCCPCAAKESMDAFFIPHASLAGEFIANGADESRLIPSGIPISQAFCVKMDKKAARRELGLAKEGKLILIGGGSIGCGRMARIAKAISQRHGSEQIVVVCGRNEKTLAKIKRLAAPNVTAVGYTSNMALYMDAADVFVTKAGGLCTTEAAAKGLPMVLVNAVPGCESRNIRFLVSNGMALSGNSLISVADAVDKLVYGNSVYDDMSAHIYSAMPKCAALAIADLALKSAAAKQCVPQGERAPQNMQDFTDYAYFDDWCGSDLYDWYDEYSGELDPQHV